MKKRVFLFILIILNLSCKEEMIASTVPQNINLFGKIVDKLGYTDLSNIHGFGNYKIKIEDVKPDVKCIGSDTFIHLFTGYEKKMITVDSLGNTDSNICVRLFIEYDSCITKSDKAFDIYKEKNFEIERMKRSLKEKYVYWPKPLQPTIKWGAIVTNNKAIQVTLHVFPLCRNLSINDTEKVVNEVLMFVSIPTKTERSIELLELLLQSSIKDTLKL